MSCGYGNLTNHNNLNDNVIGSSFSSGYKSIWLYTAYIGRVKVKVGTTNDPNKINMECKGIGSASDVIVREVDVGKSNIDINSRPSLRQLSNKPPAVVDVLKNKENFFLIQTLEMEKAVRDGNVDEITLRQTALDKFSVLEPTLHAQLSRRYASSRFNAEKLRALYVENSVVDIHFNTTLYLQFLQEKTKRQSINKSKLLLSLFNVASMDNAYFSGEYMLYGNGDKVFYPLSSIDVGGHELAHGLVQSTAGLEYKAESGALNESFADVFGTAFEFWLYDKFNTDDNPDNDLQGESDWLVGEDIGKQVEYLRNMKDPTAAQRPQPKIYKGRHWVDTRDTSDRNDYGGVHSNSGVGNYCFYLLTQEVGQTVSLNIFYNCLIKLNRSSTYAHFRDTLVECTSDQHKDKTKKCLSAVGLPVNSHPNKPKQPQPRQPRPRPRSEMVSFPNSHIPTYRQCCVHCLSRQNRRRIADEPYPGLVKKQKCGSNSD